MDLGSHVRVRGFLTQERLIPSLGVELGPAGRKFFFFFFFFFLFIFSFAGPRAVECQSSREGRRRPRLTRKGTQFFFGGYYSWSTSSRWGVAIEYLSTTGYSGGGSWLLSSKRDNGGGSWLLSSNGDTGGGPWLLSSNGDHDAGSWLLSSTGDNGAGSCLLNSDRDNGTGLWLLKSNTDRVGVMVGCDCPS